MQPSAICLILKHCKVLRLLLVLRIFLVMKSYLFANIDVTFSLCFGGIYAQGSA